jgi:hypothetical protein
MDRFGRQQHDLTALIHSKQKTKAWLFSLVWADLTITGDKNGIAPVSTDGTQKGIKFAGCIHPSTSNSRFLKNNMRGPVVDIHKPTPAYWHLGEQALDLLGNPGDDRIVEDEGQSRQEQRAEDDSDDDLHSVRDIKIAALVGERRAGAKAEAVGFVADAAGKLLHENTS